MAYKPTLNRSTWILVSALAIVSFIACQKINESTTIGNGIIPAVDNISTFETYLNAETDNFLLSDSTQVFMSDYMALGHISNDQNFGEVHADGYFAITPPNTMFYPFYRKDSIVGIDSVILSLAYAGLYGDSNSTQTLRVFEISQQASFVDTVAYRLDHANFPTVGAELGSKTYQLKQLKDSVLHIRKKDTTKLANVIRIPLNSSLGTRFANYDTSNTANGGFRSDSIFKSLFKGVAVKSDNSGNGLTYISPSTTTTKITVYFRVQKSGVIDTTFTEFFHSVGPQANLVKRTLSTEWNNYLNNGQPQDDRIYVASVPGSYGLIKVPGLDTLSNAVIHRAELIMTPLVTPQNSIFPHPPTILLDRINASGDTARTFDLDMGISDNYGSYTYDVSKFGGLLLRDSTYRFDLTRYVQKIVTNDSANFKMRVSAPIRTNLYSPLYRYRGQVTVNSQFAYGRVIIAGGNYLNPAKRLRLRVIYSKL